MKIFALLLVLWLAQAMPVQAQQIYALQLQGVQTGQNAILDAWLDANFYAAPTFSSAQYAQHVMGHPPGMSRGYIAGPTMPYIPGTSLAGLPPLGCNGFTSGC